MMAGRAFPKCFYGLERGCEACCVHKQCSSLYHHTAAKAPERHRTLGMCSYVLPRENFWAAVYLIGSLLIHPTLAGQLVTAGLAALKKPTIKIEARGLGSRQRDCKEGVGADLLGTLARVARPGRCAVGRYYFENRSSRPATGMQIRCQS